MIEVKNASFSYGKAPILKDIHLEFQPGKLYAILGPNGSGKTTLVKLLSRLVKPKTGHLLLDGQDFGSFGRAAFAQKVALLPQGRNTPNTTVWDLVCCGRYPWLDVSRKLTEEDVKIVGTALSLTRTEAFANRNVKTLSGGQRQRVYMAMLLSQDTPYVLLDEPTTHLDIGSSFEIMEQLVQIRQSGKCVITVLHDLSAALSYADEIILLDHGEVVFSGKPEDAIGRLQAVFQVKCIPIPVEGKQKYFFEPTHLCPLDPVQGPMD